MPSLIEVATQRAHEVGPHTVIGRGEGCQIRVDDPMVSAVHAEIVRAPDGTFQIRDLGSRRGTYVGSSKITEATLRDGDELLIGPMRLRFADEPAPSAIDRDELVRLRAVVELSRAIGVEHDLDRLLGRVLEACLQLVDADRAAVVVYPPGSKAPYKTLTRSRDADDADFGISSSVLGQVLASHQPYLRTEVDNDAVLQRSQSLSMHGVRSVMAVPLRYQADETEWLGVIQVDSRATVNVFRERDLELLEAIAGPAALAIKNALLVRQVQTVIHDEWQRLERIVRDLPVGIVVMDDRRTCVLVNQWVTTRAPGIGRPLPGFPIGEILGISTDQLIGGDLRTQVRAGDSDRTYSVTSSTSTDGRETVIVINDITEEVERQNKAAHRDRVALIGQLAGGVAHDFNNLLHAILSYSNLIEESAESDETRDDAQQITKAATSAAELTRQLLTFSRRELVRPTVVDVTDVIHGVEKMLARTLGPQIELATTLDPELAPVLIDTSQLEQILMNLVVNARDAMPNGGRVRLAVTATEVDAICAHRRSIAPGRYIRIELADDGDGMPPEVMARIFEPYFTTKTRGKGTGLGLATVLGIVQQARGDITVESSPGRGTTFRVFLPVTEQALDGARPMSAGSTGSGTVLLVDDDDDVRRVTDRILRNAGYRVLLATSGDEALAVARENAGTIDLLLTDVVMPGMSGRELARELCTEQPAIQVLFMSGYHQHHALIGSQCLAKPFSRAQLLENLQGLLRTPASRGAGS